MMLNPTNNTAFKLRDIASLIARNDFCLIGNPGNAGDALIALGTHHFLSNIKDKFPVYPFFDRNKMCNHDLILYSGGGNLTKDYDHCISTIRMAVKLGKKVIILPHTVAHYYDELISYANNIIIFCREQTSYYNLINAGFPINNIGLDHDMAFRIKKDYFKKFTHGSGSGIALCFRTDAERLNKNSDLNENNRDISLSWNGDLWHNQDLVISVCESLAAYLNPFDTVTTDRLHIALLCALMKKKSILYSNSYYKNEAVFNHSSVFLKKYILFSNDAPEQSKVS